MTYVFGFFVLVLLFLIVLGLDRLCNHLKVQIVLLRTIKDNVEGCYTHLESLVLYEQHDRGL